MHFVTHVDDSCVGKAFIRVCAFVCVCVCPNDGTKTAETTITKRAAGNE